MHDLSSISFHGKNQTNSVPSKAGADKLQPPFDPMLDETERILEDYVSQMAKGGSLTVNP
jgi:hypothetical protein